MITLTVKRVAVLQYVRREQRDTVTTVSWEAGRDRHARLTDSIIKTYWDATWDLAEAGLLNWYESSDGAKVEMTVAGMEALLKLEEAK